MPPNTVKVDRSTYYGNPFVVGQPSGIFEGETLIESLTLADSLNFFERLCRGMVSPEMHPHAQLWLKRIKARYLAAHPQEILRMELRGKHLACWCPLDQPCHADVLLRVANEP